MLPQALIINGAAKAAHCSVDQELEHRHPAIAQTPSPLKRCNDTMVDNNNGALVILPMTITYGRDCIKVQ